MSLTLPHSLSSLQLQFLSTFHTDFLFVSQLAHLYFSSLTLILFLPPSTPFSFLSHPHTPFLSLSLFSFSSHFHFIFLTPGFSFYLPYALFLPLTLTSSHAVYLRSFTLSSFFSHPFTFSFLALLSLICPFPFSLSPPIPFFFLGYKLLFLLS